MAKQFANNLKVKLIAGAVYSNVPYVKKAHSYIPQSELEGKKYGRTYKVYIPDPGKAVDGLTASPDDVQEVEVDVTLNNINTSLNVDAWDSLTNIESFVDEIANPRGRMLARTIEKKAIDETIFRAAQAVVGTQSLETLAKASGCLDEAGVAGTKVSFIKPTVGAEISSQALGKFIPNDIQADIYRDKYLGQFAGASQVEESLLPTVVGDDTTITLTLTKNASDATIVDPITTATGAKKGQAYKVAGLKIVDKNGIATDQDYIVVCTEDGKIPEIRIKCNDLAGDASNANAWIEAYAETLSGTNILTNGKEYYVGQVRTESAVGFDSYKFSDLPGSETETYDFDGISVKMSKFGNGMEMKSLVRLDVPYAVSLPDHREAVIAYFEK
nr:MAG TPA: coat protein [Caudoviricetes sp.]